MSNISETDAWKDKTHAKVFDYLHKLPTYIVKRHYETFNEGRLLKCYMNEIEGNVFFEIGCATGELYRYITKYMTRFKYHGFDISDPAIQRAKEKYPNGEFTLLTNGFGDLIENHGKPDVVWCRDVVLHQEQPYEFLEDVIDLATTAAIFRLRTRDNGETVFDSNLSCQFHWDKYWVPYIVLNIDELIKNISKNVEVNRIVVSRSYEVLGGQNYRFLPKELYCTNAGTSETAILVQKGKRKNSEVEVLFSDNQDRPKLTVVERLIRKISMLL